MRINNISPLYYPKTQTNNYTTKPKLQNENNKQLQSSCLPCYNIYFEANKHKSQTIPDVDYFKYKSMSPSGKQFLRKKCAEFERNIDPAELTNTDKCYLPLLDDNVMEQFIDVCKIYKDLKDEPILCLGRSPKWFLNGALWMKDGIDDYKFIAFSESWYRKDSYDNLVKIKRAEPTAEEKKAYKRYLRTMRATPQHIVDVHNKTGKKIVITDYLNSGKGACSFLDLMSEFAEEDGILDEFANSIRIVGIGCMEYRSKFYHEDEEISYPRVPLPERLWPYERTIEQKYHDMPIEVFEQMLTNENTNECRSTFYPHRTWTVYKPYNVKTGQIGQKKIDELKEKAPRSMNNFNPTMRDYRNLLNFRILDYMEQNGILRPSLNSKQWD